jgi:hypothetical protein
MLHIFIWGTQDPFGFMDLYAEASNISASQTPIFPSLFSPH